MKNKTCRKRWERMRCIETDCPVVYTTSFFSLFLGLYRSIIGSEQWHTAIFTSYLSRMYIKAYTVFKVVRVGSPKSKKTRCRSTNAIWDAPDVVLVGSFENGIFSMKSFISSRSFNSRRTLRVKYSFYTLSDIAIATAFRHVSSAKFYLSQNKLSVLCFWFYRTACQNLNFGQSIVLD